MRAFRRAGRSVIGLVAAAGFLALAAHPAPGSQESPAGLGAAAAELREDSVRFRSGDVELHGMLRLPADARGDDPMPAVVLLPGGGTQVLTMEPDYWAGRLAAAGFATLVYHKRGTGDSGGDWASATFDDFIADAGAAIEMLRRDPRIDDRIGVMGFSQGGRLAPIVAARFGAGAAVAVSGPQLPPAETRLYSLGNALREGGMPEENLEVALALWREHMDRLSSGADLAPLDPRIAEAAERMNPRALPPTSGDYTPSPIFNSLDFDGVPDLARLDVPFLALYGREDRSVPTAASVEVLRETFAASGYGGLALIVIPGVGHGLSVDPETRHPVYESVPASWLAVKLGADG
ncbi:MAG: alpha/beta hydrolase family protein [Gemmatimonadota bacterium]